MFALLYFSCLLAVSLAISLPENRQACKHQAITYIPDELDYYEEAFELSFDTSLSMNKVPVTRIVEEECGFRDPEEFSFGARSKRSVVSRGVRHLSRLLQFLYHHGKQFFKPQLLAKISNALKSNNGLMGKFKKTSMQLAAFYELVWTDLNKIRKETRDERFEEMLENAFRASIQMLLQSGKLSEVLLNEPSVLEKIKRRMPWENSQLLGMVEASSVMCHQGHRDSQVVIFMKLRIPKVARVTAQVCDDIGTIVNRTYQYYALPSTTFSRHGQVYQAEMTECYFESFLYCPKEQIRRAKCNTENLEACQIVSAKPPRNFFRELSLGFAIYGDFSQVITMKEDLASQWILRPRQLYHLVPQTNEVVFIGDQKLSQDTGSKDTVITQMPK